MRGVVNHPVGTGGKDLPPAHRDYPEGMAGTEPGQPEFRDGRRAPGTAPVMVWSDASTHHGVRAG